LEKEMLINKKKYIGEKTRNKKQRKKTFSGLVHAQAQ
jgi:hypothetical protein